MKLIDTMLLSAVLAAFVVLATSLIVQKKWRLFDVFVGKKFAYTVFVALQILAWLEVLGVSILMLFSPKNFQGMWFLGIPLIVYVAFRAITIIRAHGFKHVFYGCVFDSRIKNVSRKDRTLLVAHGAGIFLVAMFSFGQLGFLYAGILYSVLSVLLIVVEQKYLS